jgi:hypothetical protein
MATRLIDDNCATYLLCVFCKNMAFAYYPAKCHRSLTGIDTAIGNLYVGAIACSDCLLQDGNLDDMNYYIHNDVAYSYMRSTWLYQQVDLLCGEKPTIIYGKKSAVLLDMTKFMTTATDKCTLRSVICNNGSITLAPPKVSFYGYLTRNNTL